MARFVIGIDTGVNTGIAIWDKEHRCLALVETMPIHKAMAKVQEMAAAYSILVRVEDARKRTWFGNTGKERLKGAGSVERDAKIWQDFLTDLNIPFQMVHPKNNKTKTDAAYFAKVTGYTKRCSVHARDAAGLVFGF